jgi:hypothetical protein
MTEPQNIKCRCQHCHSKLEFHPSMEGQEINCPNCTYTTRLFRPADSPVPPASALPIRIPAVPRLVGEVPGIPSSAPAVEARPVVSLPKPEPIKVSTLPAKPAPVVAQAIPVPPPVPQTAVPPAPRPVPVVPVAPVADLTSSVPTEWTAVSATISGKQESSEDFVTRVRKQTCYPQLRNILRFIHQFFTAFAVTLFTLIALGLVGATISDWMDDNLTFREKWKATGVAFLVMLVFALLTMVFRYVERAIYQASILGIDVADTLVEQTRRK